MRAEPSTPLGNDPTKTNWVETYHALPKGSWIRRAAEHIKAKGKPDSEAIPFAVNAARRVCRTGDTNLPGLQQVDPGKRADACAAVAIWDAARARAKASKDLSAVEWFRTIDLAGARLARGLDLTDSQREVIDLATRVVTANSAQPARLNGLYSVAQTVARLRKHPKLKNLPDAELQKIAAARIARRQVRNQLGITDLKKLPAKQLKALEKAGLVGGGKAAPGTVVSYTLQRGPRKGQTIQIKRTAAGWHEVRTPTVQAKVR